MRRLIKSLIIFSIISLCFSGLSIAKELSGDLIIFHAGSLAIPFRQMADFFKQKHPKVNILAEAAGSRNCARKISDLGRHCDVMASAD